VVSHSDQRRSSVLLAEVATARTSSRAASEVRHRQAAGTWFRDIKAPHRWLAGYTWVAVVTWLLLAAWFSCFADVWEAAALDVVAFFVLAAPKRVLPSRTTTLHEPGGSALWQQVEIRARPVWQQTVTVRAPLKFSGVLPRSEIPMSIIDGARAYVWSPGRDTERRGGLADRE
jgi:hypothetical protein